MLLQSSGIMYNYLYLKVIRRKFIHLAPVTHLETNQLTCTASWFTDAYIRQCITKIKFRKHYTFMQCRTAIKFIS